MRGSVVTLRNWSDAMAKLKPSERAVLLTSNARQFRLNLVYPLYHQFLNARPRSCRLIKMMRLFYFINRIR